MDLLLFSILMILGAGVAALLACRFDRWISPIGAGGCILGCAAGLFPALQTLLNHGTALFHRPWQIPYGAFALRLDCLSALFLLPILLVGGATALYGMKYMESTGSARSRGAFWFFFNLLLAGMMGVVLADNAVLFLIAWEVMSLAAYFLVTHEDQDEKVLRAGWIYLISTHLGTSFLLALFILLGRHSGSLDFQSFTQTMNMEPRLLNVLFLLAVVGFGAKAGFIPLHVWLPEAHPAAPSPVSAVMSGVMIKMGIYGLVRFLSFAGPPPVWWAWLLVMIGISSGILGVLFALAQHDLKRLLAYHSVENIGIITLGLGVGLLGLHTGSPFLAAVGFGGGLLHVVNHALFKGLLFLGAGAVAHATHTREMDHLGGLLKQMPWTGWTFLVGAAAICGLPPLNGFISEFFIYVSAFRGAVRPDAAIVLPALGVIAALALIGGLAVACFTKAFGVVFLGEPRTEHATRAVEVSLGMRIAMLILATLCFTVAAGAPFLPGILAPAVSQLTSLPIFILEENLSSLLPSLWMILIITSVVIVFTLLLLALRRARLAKQEVTEAVTWDCGYALPSARMQYTSSSYAQPLANLFGSLLRTRTRLKAPRGLFPQEGSFESETPDVFQEKGFQPLFTGASWLLARFRWLQHGDVHLYVLYIALTLVILLVWKLK